MATVPLGKPATNLPKEELFLRAAFENEQDQVSDLLETQTGGYLIVRVDAVTPPAIRPLDSVRDQVVAAWKIAQQDEAARNKASAILDKVKSGGALTTVAKKAGLEARPSKPFTRFNRAAGSRIPPALARALFRLRPGGTAMAPSAEGYAVAQLKDVRAASPAADKEGFDGLKDQMHAAVANDVIAQYASALRARYSVRIDHGAIDRLFNEGTLGQY